MNHFIAYLLKVIVCSAIFFAYYLLVLRNKNFHPYNRFYLLSTAIVSAFLPLLHISMFDFSSDNARMLALFQMLGSGELPEVVVGNRSSILDWKQIGLLISLSITFILLVIMVVRIARVFRLKKRFPRKTVNNINFINTNIEQAPFSFLNNLFWRKDILLTDKVGEQIYRHEMAHIHQKHSIDKLLMQVLRAVFWMNPVYYYIQRELLLIHEFMADQKAIEEGDGEAFARMLLAAQYGSFQFEPAHSLSYSSIKKRLHMITNSHKPKYSYLRRLLFLPLLFTVTFVFALRAHQKQVAEQTANLEAMVAETQHPASPVNTSSQQPQKSVFVALAPSKDKGPDQGVVFQSNDSTHQPLILVDGKELPAGTSLKELDANDIKSINVLKDGHALDKYGKKGQYGVIEVTTKAAARKTGQTDMAPVRIVGYADQLDTNKKEKQSTHKTSGTVRDIVVVGHPGKSPDSNGKAKLSRITIRGAQGEPIYIVDGKRISKEQMNEILPNDIESITVLKDKSATRLYGKDAADGAILITTKMAVAKAGNNPADLNKVDQEPRFPGGNQAWRRYLERNLMSDVPVKNGAPVGQYEIIVSFLVDKQGHTSEFKVISQPEKDYGTAAEAIRVMKESGNWLAAEQNGTPVVFRAKQKIIFQISK